LLAAAGAIVLSSCSDNFDSEWVATVDGEDITRADLEDFAEAQESEALLTGGDESRAMITQMIRDDFAASPATAQAAYESWPDGAPVACLGAILVEDEAAATAVKEALADGMALADLVAEFGIEGQEQLAPDGIVYVNGAECLADELNPALQSALADVEFGEGVDFATGAGLTVVFLRPWDSLSDEARETIAGVLIDEEQLAAADISVNARFGQWDIAIGAVLPAAG
jgi:hypothetical protein